MKNEINKYMIRKLHAIYSAHNIDDDQKKYILLKLTNGRTSTTSGLTQSEASYLAGHLNGGSTQNKNREQTILDNELKRSRSAVLKRMQKIGIDTTDWDAVNRFCSDTRIAGKVFRQMDAEELINLVPKLESILKKRDR